MSVPRERLLKLLEARCHVFSNTFNPDRRRLGNKILRQRLRGPALAAYYPPRVANIRDLMRVFEPLKLETEDEWDEDRLESLAALRARGKGAPKKKKGPPDNSKARK